MTLVTRLRICAGIQGDNAVDVPPQKRVVRDVQFCYRKRGKFRAMMRRREAALIPPASYEGSQYATDNNKVGAHHEGHVLPIGEIRWTTGTQLLTKALQEIRYL